MLANGLQGELLETTVDELANAASANTLAMSEKAATTSTLGLGTAIKGLGIKLKELAASNPILLAITAAIIAIGAAFKYMEYEGKALERQQEKLEDALSAYEDVKSELETINSELDENKKKIDELESKPKLTYAEKGQLEELQRITEELKLQKEISEWDLANKQKDAAVEAVEYVNTKYNLGNSNTKDVDELVPDVLAEDWRNFEAATNNEVTDAEYLAARYKAMLNKTEDLRKEAAELLNSDEIFPEDIDMANNDVKTYEGFTEELKTEINDMLLSLMEQKANMQDYYDTIKDTPYEDMSTDARNCYDTMQQIDASMQTLYYGLGNNRFNSEIIDGIFNTDDIEVTKEELIEMAQAGTLNPMTIKGYENLADAILNSNLVADEGCGLFETLCNEIYASVEASEEAAHSMKAFSKSEIIDSINALSDGFDIIDKIYSDVKDGDVFDFTNLDTKKFQEAFGDLGVEYENFIEKISETPDDINACQKAFNDLVSKYLEASGVLNNLDEENAKVTASILELMGITNAQELVDDALLRKKAELVSQSDEYTNAIKEYTDAVNEYATATDEEKQKLDEKKQSILEEIDIGGKLGQQISQITLQKILANEKALDTANDINAIYLLAETAGFGAEALLRLEEARSFLMEAEASGDVDQINEAKDAIRRIVSVEQQKLANFSAKLKYEGLKYEGADTSNKKSGGSSKSSSEKDLWLEEYKKKLKELENMRDKGIINEREFFDQSEILLNTYLKDSQAHIEKYEEEISDAEKQLHDDWNAAYESDAKNLKKWQEKKLINMADYYQSMMNLQDEYYNSEALKLKELADKMEAEYGRMSHISFTRPSVDAADIQSAGYATDLEASSVYAQSFGNEIKQVVVTPILPDGTILSPETLASYANSLLNGEKIDADIQLALFEGNDAVKQTEEYINGLEKMQSEYQNLKKIFAENPYGDFTEDQLKAIEELTKAIEEHKNQLSGELGDIKSAYDDLIEIRDTYNKYGKISVDQYQSLCDMGFEYLALLSDESGALSLDEDAFQRLTDAKIQQIQVDMALQAADLIKNIQTEEQAVQYLTNAYDNLANGALSAAENMLYAAQANAELMYGAESMQAQAAANIVKGYENSKLLAGNIDIKMQSGGGYKEEKEEKEEKKFLKTFDWIGTLLEKISDKTSKLINKVDKFYNWQKKNSMINRAVKSTDREISQNERAYQAYMKKANSVGLSATYVNKIQNGTLSIQDITSESLSNKIDKYQEWYDKAQSCLETIEDLYDKQRDLIRQKLDNVIDYYSDLDSYLSSITSKIESLISLNDEMGKRSSLTELVEQFSKLSDQLESATNKEIGGVTVTEGSLGDSKKVAEAKEHDQQELVDSIQAEIDDLKDIKKTGTYQRLLDNIEKKKADIDKYESKGWDTSKAKSYQKLQKELQNYYDLQKALDENATSDTIANYEKIYTAYQKLQNKIDSGKTLSKSEQKKFDQYTKELEDLKAKGQSALDKLYDELAEANGTATKQTEADKIQNKIDGIQSDLENTATYQNLLKTIENTESKIAELDKKGYNNLTKSQKKTYDKLKAQLEDYYAQKETLDENATAANIAEYNKTYLAWKKLQDKLDSGGNLTQNQWKQYNSYTEQLKDFADEKAGTISELNDALSEALDPSDKLGQIEKTYEESAKGIYDSYQNQIDSINGEAEKTKQYQNLLAKAQQLEQKKDTKKFSTSDQATLDKYNAELKALQAGATGSNISDYMKTWEAWYKLDQELNKNGKLSDSKAKKYDEYKAKLDAWNEEKQTQINDLLSLMEDDLEQLQKTYTENVSEAESEMNDYYANLYSLAKQIAEYNLTTLQAQLNAIETCISYYKELVSLYDSFDGDKLVKILKDLGEIDENNEVSSRMDLYSDYLDNLKEKYNLTLAEINEYKQLLGALETDSFESSMELFDKAMKGYKESGNTAMAEKLQSVLDILNERAIDANNWDEFADEWFNEWYEELSSSKQELIGVATEIQEVNDALRQIRFEHITDAIDDLEKASGILSSIAGLIKDEWLFEPDGSLSEYGRAKAALLVSQLEDAQSKANEYLKLYNEIQNNKDTYASDKAFKDASNEALQNYYDSLNSAASLENSILDLMKKNAEEEINSLKDVIEARKKALQAKKDYYDYDKSIKNSQKEIDSLKAQIDALESLSDATDAATKAKLAQLKAELSEKEDALQETKDEHTFNLQIDALDKFAESLTDALDESTKSVEEILKEQKEIIESAKDLYQTSTDSVNDTLDKVMAFYSGMGMSIDGADLVPDVNNDSESDSIINADLGLNNTTKADATSKFIEEASEAFKNGVLVRTSDAEMLKVFDENMLNFLQANLPPIFNAVQPIPDAVDYIKSKGEAATVINNYYDCLLNVEGNVDKNVLPDLKTIIREACEYTKNDIYQEQMRLGTTIKILRR